LNGSSSLDSTCSSRRKGTRLIAIALLALAIATSPLAATAEIHRVDSPLMRDLSTLFVSQGLSLPSTAGPWSGDELLFFSEKLDTGSLSEAEQRIYDHIIAALTADKKPVSATVRASLEAYLHTNTKDFTTQDDWVYSYLDRNALISIPVELSLGPWYGYVDVSLVNRNIDARDNPAVNGVSSLYGTRIFTTNLPIQFPSEGLQIDSNIPYYAALAVGGGGWSIETGRQQLSWGPGYSGNFLLGSHVQYHNMARLSAYRGNFKYGFVTSFFPHPDEIWGTAPSGQGREIKGLKMFLAHRFEFRLFKDRLGLAINESIMYQNKEGIDLRVLNPMMLYHNYFIRSNANSLATLEMDWALSKGWNLYGQIAVDELSFGSAEWNLADEEKHPNGLAFMLGSSYAHVAEQGIVTAHIEGVYTDPYLYLRSIHGDADQASDADNLNFVIAIRRWLPDKVIYDQEYMGYRYGGDAIVLDSGVEYRSFSNWYIKGRLFAMVHGEIGQLDLWKKGELSLAPSGNPTFYVQTGVSVGKRLGHFECYGSLDYLARIHEYKAVHDLQLAIGATWSLTKPY
jgi:hypothetical protein